MEKVLGFLIGGFFRIFLDIVMAPASEGGLISFFPSRSVTSFSLQFNMKVLRFCMIEQSSFSGI